MGTPTVCFSALDLSTAHITPNTRTMMVNERLSGVLYYAKGPWGWFVNVPSKADGIEVADEVPPDLKACIEYAQAGEHEWIILDCDGSVSALLPVYGDIDLSPVIVAGKADQVEKSKATGPSEQRTNQFELKSAGRLGQIPHQGA